MKEKNTLATIAFGISIGILFTGIIFAMIPFLGIIINAIPLTLGIMSLLKIKSNPNLSGKIKSIIAIVIGGFLLFIHFIQPYIQFFLIYFSFIFFLTISIYFLPLKALRA